jgi:RimJ/RimL family protein N-acetyltransferase
VAFWVAPAFWNHGIASAAVQALVTANPKKNCTMFAEAFQDNPGSARVLTNAGFQYLGDAESFSVARGTTAPTWTYIRKLD